MTVTLEELARRLDRVESLLAIRNLQHAYGYYLDKTLYSEVVELFTEDCQIVFMGGVYRGRAGAERLYLQRFRQRFTDGRNGPMQGFLLDHPQLQDVITVSEDGGSARARLRTLMQAGTHYTVKAAGEQRSSRDQWWEGGIYENEYLRVDGVWKIQRLNYQPLWHADFETGWARSEQHFVPEDVAFPENPVGPDELVDKPHELWPSTDVVPFHYPHPVTREEWKQQ
ncbi:nuclear transport factor 2 family protein [Streptomyces sp. NPDC055400]